MHLRRPQQAAVLSEQVLVVVYTCIWSSWDTPKMRFNTKCKQDVSDNQGIIPQSSIDLF